MINTNRSCSPSVVKQVTPHSNPRPAPKLPPSARNVPCCRNAVEPYADFPDLRSEDIPQIELIQSMIHYKISTLYTNNNESLMQFESNLDVPDFESLYFQEHHRVRDLEVELRQLKQAFDKMLRDKQVSENNYEAFIAEMQAEQNALRSLEFKLHEVDDWRRRLEEQVRRLTIENELLRAREESTSEGLLTQLKTKMREYHCEKSNLLNQLDSFQTEISDLKDKMEHMKQQSLIEQSNFERVVDHLLKENDELRGAVTIAEKKGSPGQASAIHTVPVLNTTNSHAQAFVTLFNESKNLHMSSQPQVVNTYGKALANEKHDNSMDQSTIAPSIDSMNDPMYSPYQIFQLKAEDIMENLNEGAQKQQANQKNTTTIFVKEKFSEIFVSQGSALQRSISSQSNPIARVPIITNVVQPESSPAKKRIRLEDRFPSYTIVSPVIKAEPIVVKTQAENQDQQKSMIMSNMSFTKKPETKYEECESLNVSKEIKLTDFHSVVSNREEESVDSTVKVDANAQAKD